MYSRYDPTAHGPFRPIDEAEDRAPRTIDFPAVEPPPQQPDAPQLPDHTEASAKPQKQGGILDSLRGLLGGLRRENSKPLDIGDLLLLAIIAMLVLEDGGETDLIIVLAIALIVGF